MKDVRVHYSIQTIFEDVNEKNSVRRTDLIGTVLYIRGISRCMEGKYIEGFRIRKFGI